MIIIQLVLVRASDQSIIDRQGILMQMLLVAGLNIVLFTSKHTVTNIMSIHMPNADERLLPTDTRPENRLVQIRVIALV